MAKVIDMFNNTKSVPNEDISEAQDSAANVSKIFSCYFDNKDGTQTKLALLKAKETGKIGIGIIENYKDSEAYIEHYGYALELCDDDDDFVYNKLMEVLEASTLGP